MFDFLLYLFYSIHDIVIRTTAADIPAHQFVNGGIRRSMPLTDQPNRRTDLARSAIAALVGVMFYKSLLHGMEGIPLCQPFDGRHFRSLTKTGECKTGIDPLPVDQYSTGSALAPV